MSREFEALCAIGNVGKVERRVAVFVVYIPPDMRAPSFEKLKEEIASEIVAVKRAYKNPIIYVCGDLNHRDLGAGIKEVKDFELVETGPTRGTSTIDLVYTNALKAVSEAATVPPWSPLGACQATTGVFLSTHLFPRNASLSGSSSGGGRATPAGRRSL